MGKNNYIVKCNQELAIFSNSEEKIIRTHDVKIPPILLDAISSTIKAQPDLENAAKDLSGLVEVDIGPFKEGLDSGELYRNSYELEIRDLKTGKYVGKAKLKEAELPETKSLKHNQLLYRKLLEVFAAYLVNYKWLRLLKSWKPLIKS